MATFTIELWKVMEIERDTGNGFRLGLSDYPIYDLAYRDSLNRKIVNHYYNREIGLETISMFQFNLRRKMFEIMPYYNQLYKSTQIIFDPLATFDLATVRNGTATESGNQTGTTSSNANGTSGSRVVNSDTPQTQLSEDESYASSGTDSNSATASSAANTTTGVSSQNESRNEASTTKGFQGSAADLLMKFRDTLLNIDMMIVAELNELFMGVWDNSEEMLPSFGGTYNQIGALYW